MGLFSSRQPKAPSPRLEPANEIPITQVDFSKRYDVYCTDIDHDKLYEDVRFVGIRTFDRITEFSSGYVSGYLEIEAVDGSRWLIRSFGIQLICEHGTQPVFKVLRRRRNPRDYKTALRRRIKRCSSPLPEIHTACGKTPSAIRAARWATR